MGVSAGAVIKGGGGVRAGFKLRVLVLTVNGSWANPLSPVEMGGEKSEINAEKEVWAGGTEIVL